MISRPNLARSYMTVQMELWERLPSRDATVGFAGQGPLLQKLISRPNLARSYMTVLIELWERLPSRDAMVGFAGQGPLLQK